MIFIWKLLKIKAIALVVLIAVTIWIFVWINSAPERKGYDADVRADLKHAANGQEAYFKDNGTYTNRIGSLKGFNQSANVNINMEATTTTYRITGTATEGCKANTGTWHIDNTTGDINGTPCH